MKTIFTSSLILSAVMSVTAWVQPLTLHAAPWDPAAADYSGHGGKTLYVSRQGDNTDGSSWQKAFRTIQAALAAVPDDQGGHRIVVRPDTYVEANLCPSHKGAAGAYNLLIGDCDGRLGSGAVGRVVIDSGDPEKGFKSSAAWSTVLSSITWDRWILRNLYAVGGDAAFFWDLADQGGSEFTVVVEDCVGIGRAYGGGFGYPVVREKEPIVFRRCYLMCLDFVAGAGALGVGASNKLMPARPDAICEDCTLVSPENAVHVLQGPTPYTRVKFKNCRLIGLNFSPPHSDTPTGIICSDAADPKMGWFHADLEESDLMGCKLFGTGSAAPGRISYTAKGKIRAYVQYRQPTPKEFERLGLVPFDILSKLAIPGSKPAIADNTKLAPLPPVAGDPSSPGYAGRKGATLYVSKLGDNSDGRSWQTAFHTIQAALVAVPDAHGGHRIIIRPDTYTEAMLFPRYKGARGAYNLLVGDRDGSLGSGATGWVVIDAGCPGVAVRNAEWTESFKIVESKEPETGLKSCDWWSAMRCEPDYSGIAWDRWMLRNLCVTGAEGGPGVDLLAAGFETTIANHPKKGPEFTMVVDDCVGIGRFCGAGVATHTPRKDEPVLFRRGYFMNLDHWVDDGGVYVRGEDRVMPAWPHATFDDCTIIGPAKALKVNLDTCTWVRFKNCRLIALNFSQPRLSHKYGVSILCCDSGSKKIRLDFEDSTLMGYSLFCQHSDGAACNTTGKVRAYVQFEQTLPVGFERLGLWPVETFDSIAPPTVGNARTMAAK